MIDPGDKQATRLVPRKFMPWEGFRFTLDDCSIYASTISILQPGLQFTEKEFGAYFNRVATFLDGLAKNPIREIGPHKPLHEPPSVRVPLTLYKYVTEDTYDRFIKRGRLRLGSLSYYRRVENIQARDEWEGFAIVNLTGNTQEIFSSVLSGFEYAILCLSTLSTRDLSMESKFGRVLLRIHDVPGLISTISRMIKALSVDAKPIFYSDGKYIQRKAAIPAYDFNCLKSTMLTASVFNHFRKAAIYPSVFVKPQFYSAENEFRLAFNLGRDVPDFLDIESASLASFFQPI